MNPTNLQSRDFNQYPPAGRALAAQHLDLLRSAPFAIVPSLLSDLFRYDTLFPVQQRAIDRRFVLLSQDPHLLQNFSGVTVPAALFEGRSWVSEPGLFLQVLTNYLWSSGQMDLFQSVSARLVADIELRAPSPLPVHDRVIVLLIGKDADPDSYPLFDQLREHGQLFTQFDTRDAHASLTKWFNDRSTIKPLDYGHWYIDGGIPISPLPASAITLTYPGVAPVRNNIIQLMQKAIREGTGPEVLRGHLTSSSVVELGAASVSDDPRMQHFIVSLLTEASGTQLFSTTFVQWAIREALRQAEPITLLARFQPRQMQRAFNSMVDASPAPEQFDHFGSLVDADMSAWYTYLELQRLTGRAQTRTIVWLEDRPLLLACGPEFVQATTSNRPIGFADILQA